MQRNVAIVHYNTPELTEACIKSLRKHGGEDYKVFIFDNSDKRPFKKRMKGVKVFNNTKGKYLNFDEELEKYPTRSRYAGCSKNNEFGSDKHMMSVQRLWELVPDGFLLLDSDVLVKASLEEMFLEGECTKGYISRHSGPTRIPRLLPLLLWINVPMCVAGGARFFDPDRAWALHADWDPRNYWDTGAAFLDDIRRLKPQCHGKQMTRERVLELIVHFKNGSWARNNVEEHKAWLEKHRDLWE